MDSYQYKAMAAQRFLIEAGMDPNWADLPLNLFPWHLITPAIAVEYWQILVRRYSNVKSRENLIGVVRRLTRECAAAGLISYADREQILDSLPVQSAPMSRPGREVDDGEIQLLLTTHTTSSHRLNLRNVAIVAVFLSTGLRVSEVAELSVGDIVFDERGAAVNVRRTKSGTTHLAWLNLTAVPYVKDWLAVRGEGDGALFDTDARRHVNMSAGCLRQVVARHAHAAGLTRRLGCHDFRRTFATRALRGGADPFSVQKLLGHKNVNSTLVYDYRGELETRAIVEMLIIPTHLPRTWRS